MHKPPRCPTGLGSNCFSVGLPDPLWPSLTERLLLHSASPYPKLEVRYEGCIAVLSLDGLASHIQDRFLRYFQKVVQLIFTFYVFFRLNRGMKWDSTPLVALIPHAHQYQHHPPRDRQSFLLPEITLHSLPCVHLGFFGKTLCPLCSPYKPTLTFPSLAPIFPRKRYCNPMVSRGYKWGQTT